VTVDQLLGRAGPADPGSDGVIHIAALAGRMTPEQRAKVEGYMAALLDKDEG